MQITKKLIISNTLWSAVAQVLVMGINLLVLPLFIKNLGAELFGIWVISNVVLGYLNVFDFGFTQGLQKYVAEARVKGDLKELSVVVVSGVGLLLFIGLLLGGACFLSAQSIVVFFKIQPENQLVAVRLLQISALFCVIMWPLRIVNVVLNASMRIKELNLLNLVTNGGQSIIMLVLVLAASDIITIKWITAGFLAAGSAFGLVLVNQYVPEISWHPFHFKFGQIRRMHRFSLGMFFASLLGMLSVQIDTLIIGRLMSMNAVTAYTVASRVFLLLTRITSLLITALMPSVYNLNAVDDKRRIKLLLFEMVRARTCVTVTMVPAAIVLLPAFISLWFGPDYAGYAGWAQAFCLIPLFTCLGVANIVARTCGYVKQVNIIFSVQIMVNLAISILTIPALGIGGAIMGTIVATSVFGGFVFFPYYCRLIEVGFRRSYFCALKGVFVAAAATGLFYAVWRAVPANWITMGCATVAFSGLSGLAAWLTVFSSDEKKGHLQFIQRLVRPS
jgi:O-antigen/teichoic acid export membrane protein